VVGKSGWTHTEDARRRIGDAFRGKTCPSGCGCWKHSEQTRRRQSEAAKRYERPAHPPGCNCRVHEGTKCLPGCSCGRHQVSAEARRKRSESWRNRSPEVEARRLEAARRVLVGNKWAAGTIFSEEERQRRSKLSRKMWAEGVFEGESRPNWGRSAGFHAGVRMRCLNTEGVFAKDCEANGITWIYEPRRFKLSWCTYTPDFYLPEFDIWVEVKGWSGQIGNWPQKIETFRRETGKTLVVVFQRELSSKKYGGE